MSIPEEHRKGFELHKYYQHFGVSKIHIIAETEVSDMWHIDPGTTMFIAESREGDLQPVNSHITACQGYYEITKEIFIEDIPCEETKLGTMEINHDAESQMYDRMTIPRFILRVYRNNQLYFFDLLDHYDEDGLHINLIENDVNGIFNNIQNHVKKEELAIIEKILFERL